MNDPEESLVPADQRRINESTTSILMELRDITKDLAKRVSNLEKIISAAMSGRIGGP
jgi:hypothetical protein